MAEPTIEQNYTIGVGGQPVNELQSSPNITGIPQAGWSPIATTPELAEWSPVVSPIYNTGGPININTLLSSPLVPDGVTSNVPMFQSLATILQGVGMAMPVPVNLTVGSPTVLSLNPTAASDGTLPDPCIHYLKPNQAFYFTISPGGSLPAGIALGTTYYITSANLTATTFTFSAANNYGRFTNEGSVVNTTGSLTGTASIVLTGQDISLFIPPGPYFGGNYGSPAANVTVTPNGISRIRYYAYGASFDTKITFGTPFGPNGCLANANGTLGEFDYVDTTPNEGVVSLLDGQVTLITTAHVSRYWIGQWLSIFGLNIQDPYGHLVSGPPNYQYQEFKRIKAIDPVGGVLTLDGPLKWVYLSSFPNLFTPGAGQVGGGSAMIASMHPSWDTEVGVYGAQWIGEPVAGCARRFLYQDCIFGQGYGNAPGQAGPSVAQSYIYRNCRFGPSPGNSGMEVDKMMEYLELDGCSTPNKYPIFFPSVSLQLCAIKNHQGSSIQGTPRQIRITESELDSLLIGPQIGVTDSAFIQQSRFVYFDMQERDDDNITIRPGNDMTLVPNWSFSNGTFTRNISGLPGQQGMLWMIPGVKIYMTDAGNIYTYGQNMGGSFTILNVYMDGSGNFSFDTTLSAVPARQTSHTVTITEPATPAVVTWASHGLIAGTPVVFTTTGALPTGLSISTAYYVTNDGNLATNTFAVSSTHAGALAGTGQINTTGAGSGTHTAYGNPLCFRPHPCASLTSAGNSGCMPMLDLNGAINEPLFSRVRRAFVGKQSTLSGESQQFQQPNPRIWGFLKTMNVNVLKAGTASGTLTISCPGFTQPDLALSNFSQVIDTTAAGVRTVTSAATTGSSGSDSLSAYADWVAGPLVFTWSTGVTLPNSPIVEFEIFTDQGITRFGGMMGAPAIPAGSGSELWQYIDSGIVQQYGTTP